MTWHGIMHAWHRKQKKGQRNGTNEKRHTGKRPPPLPEDTIDSCTQKNNNALMLQQVVDQSRVGGRHRKKENTSGRIPCEVPPGFPSRLFPRIHDPSLKTGGADRLKHTEGTDRLKTRFKRLKRSGCSPEQNKKTSGAHNLPPVDMRGPSRQGNAPSCSSYLPLPYQLKYVLHDGSRVRHAIRTNSPGGTKSGPKAVPSVLFHTL